MTIMGYPWYELFLFFFFYSFLGWLMETCYCSIHEHKLVPRGFLYGPICPIYGCGVLLMVLFFTPLKGNLVLFYVTAVVVMTSWEYFVGWFLETTTHMKYWDYSHSKFNIKGRVCLWVALTWGVLSYVVIFWIHPAVESLYERIPLWLVYTLCGTLGTILVADVVLTIRQLALVSKFMEGATAAGEELKLKLAEGRENAAAAGEELKLKLAEGRENAAAAGEELKLKLALGKAELTSRLDDGSEELRRRYREQLSQLERYSRRFRKHYAHMTVSNKRYRVTLDDVKAAGALAKEELLKRKAEAQAARQAKKNTK